MIQFRLRISVLPAIAFLLILGLAAPVYAEDTEAVRSDGNREEAVRARLISPIEGQALGEKDLESEVDMGWEAITEGGPASGADPIIGEGSGVPYYSFPDGIPFPYYVQQ